MAVDFFSRRFLLPLLAQLKPPRRFVLDSFFPMERTFDTESVDVDIRVGRRRMAPFVRPSGEARLVEKRGYRTRTIKPAYIKPAVQYVPSDLFLREPGEELQGMGLSPDARLQRRIAEDLQDLQDQIDRREEWMAAQALLNGTVAIVGEGYNETVDFLMPSNHKVVLSGTDLWSDAAAKPIEKIREWMFLISQNSGITPDRIIMGEDALNAFISHANVKGELDTRRIELGQINVSELPNGVTAVGSLFSGAVDVFGYHEWFIDDNEVEQPMIPANKIIFGSTRARSERLYGAIQNFNAGGGLLATRWWPNSYLKPDGTTRVLELHSAPLPSPIQVDAYLNAQVLP